MVASPRTKSEGSQIARSIAIAPRNRKKSAESRLLGKQASCHAQGRAITPYAQPNCNLTTRIVGRTRIAICPTRIAKCTTDHSNPKRKRGISRGGGGWRFSADCQQPNALATWHVMALRGISTPSPTAARRLSHRLIWPKNVFRGYQWRRVCAGDFFAADSPRREIA
jgi:hypothetical protein